MGRAAPPAVRRARAGRRGPSSEGDFVTATSRVHRATAQDVRGARARGLPVLRRLAASSARAGRSSSRQEARRHPRVRPTRCRRTVRRAGRRRGATAAFRVLVKDVKGLQAPRGRRRLREDRVRVRHAGRAPRRPAREVGEAKEREAEGVHPRSRAAGDDRPRRRGAARFARRRGDRPPGPPRRGARRAVRPHARPDARDPRDGTAPGSPRTAASTRSGRSSADLALEASPGPRLEVTADEIGAEIAVSPRPTTASPKELAKAARSQRPGRDAGRGYHPNESPRPRGRTCRYQPTRPGSETAEAEPETETPTEEST